MPLQVSTASPTSVADSLTHTSTPTFVVIYASVTDGRSWCGDCRAAEPFINAKFGQSEDVVRIIYAGQRDEYVALYHIYVSDEGRGSGGLMIDWLYRWRKQGNPWRQEPFSVTNLPTVIKVTGDVSVARETVG